MKDSRYVESVCGKFCRYYKEGKEELYCGGYKILEQNLTASELSELVKTSPPKLKSDNLIHQLNLETDKKLRVFVCDKCDFKLDGCDFRDGYSGAPCGGYTILYSLFESEK
ncbi:MAG: hypothetical protein HQL10_07205 [Nitrospirae bacterium]|nr:hypothetical protein [Nitrospirota bacterium]